LVAAGPHDRDLHDLSRTDRIVPGHGGGSGAVPGLLRADVAGESVLAEDGARSGDAGGDGGAMTARILIGEEKMGKKPGPPKGSQIQT